MQLRFLAFRILLFMFLLVTPALAQRATGKRATGKRDWPQWLGPDRSGVTDESGWSADWPAQGLKLLWTREVGIGFSSISVRDGLAYTMGHQDGKETVWCLNHRTGGPVWSRSYPCELIDNLYDGGPGATPTINDGRLYTVGKEGQLICFDRLNGRILWQRDLREELDIDTPEWGFNGSPYILGNQLFLEAGRVVCFDKRDGTKLWQTRKHHAGYGSVTPFSADGEVLLATLDCDGLRVVTAKDGTERAFQAWPSPFETNSTTPIVHNRLIYVSSGYNMGCGLFEYRDQELKQRYTSRKMRNHFNNSILHRGYLYGFDGNSNLGRVVTLKCMNFETGEIEWEKRGLGCGSLIIADNRLLVLSEEGDLVLALAAPTGYVELSRSPLLEGRCWTTPVLVQGTVLARNAAGKLVCAALPPAGNPAPRSAR